MIRQNLKYKLMALAIALIIWSYANMNQSREVTRHIPEVTVQFRGLEPGYLATCKPDSVDIVLRGDKTDLDEILSKPELITAYVDLAGRTAGKYNLPVRVSVPGVYNSPVIKKTVPDKVTVTLENKISRLFDIKVQMLSRTPEDYQFAPPMISSKKAVVSGPARLVNSVRGLVVQLDPGDSASTIEGDFTVVAVDRRGHSVQGVDINPDKVHLVMKLISAPMSKVVYIVPNITGLPLYPYKVTKIDVDPQTAFISGKPAIISKISVIHTERIDISGHTKTVIQSVDLVLPEGVKSDIQGPVKVTVHIEGLQQQEQQKPTPPKASGGNNTGSSDNDNDGSNN